MPPRRPFRTLIREICLILHLLVIFTWPAKFVHISSVEFRLRSYCGRACARVEGPSRSVASPEGGVRQLILWRGFHERDRSTRGCLDDGIRADCAGSRR